MKILIARNGEDIISASDYSDVESKGEIAHVLAELEIIKLDLLELWEDWKEREE